MEKDYKIYKRQGYTYVRYKGASQAMRYEKYETVYDYDWGLLVIGEKDGRKYFNFSDGTEELAKALNTGVIIEKQGRYGAQDKDGKEILPCVFDQIEKLEETVFGRLDDSYWELSIPDGGGTLRGCYNNTGFFVKNGKKGWQENGKVVVPALYDYIEQPRESNFWRVKTNGRFMYIDKDLNSVLTQVSQVGDEEDTDGGADALTIYTNILLSGKTQMSIEDLSEAP